MNPSFTRLMCFLSLSTFALYSQDSDKNQGAENEPQVSQFQQRVPARWYKLVMGKDGSESWKSTKKNISQFIHGSVLPLLDQIEKDMRAGFKARLEEEKAEPGSRQSYQQEQIERIKKELPGIVEQIFEYSVAEMDRLYWESDIYQAHIAILRGDNESHRLKLVLDQEQLAKLPTMTQEEKNLLIQQLYDKRIPGLTKLRITALANCVHKHLIKGYKQGEEFAQETYRYFEVHKEDIIKHWNKPKEKAK